MKKHHSDKKNDSVCVISIEIVLKVRVCKAVGHSHLSYSDTKIATKAQSICWAYL